MIVSNVKLAESVRGHTLQFNFIAFIEFIYLYRLATRMKGVSKSCTIGYFNFTALIIFLA